MKLRSVGALVGGAADARGANTESFPSSEAKQAPRTPAARRLRLLQLKTAATPCSCQDPLKNLLGRTSQHQSDKAEAATGLHDDQVRQPAKIQRWPRRRRRRRRGATRRKQRHAAVDGDRAIGGPRIPLHRDVACSRTCQGSRIGVSALAQHSVCVLTIELQLTNAIRFDRLPLSAMLCGYAATC